MSEPRWWIYRDDQVSDRPYTRNELLAMKLPDQVLICREGEDEWKPLMESLPARSVPEANGDRFPPLVMPDGYADLVDREATPDLLHEKGLCVTELSSTASGFSVTFNQEITIHRVRLNEGSIRWPREKQGSDYPLVVVHQPEITRALEALLQSGDLTPQDSGDLNVSIARFNPYESGKLKGFFDLDIQGLLVIKGFKLMESNDGNGYWVGVPSVNRGGNWIDQVEVSRDLKRKLAELAEHELQS